MMVKDYRGKNGEWVVWRFDAALNAQLLDLLKQAAFGEGEWGAKPEDDPVERLRLKIAYLNAAAATASPGPGASWMLTRPNSWPNRS